MKPIPRYKVGRDNKALKGLRVPHVVSGVRRLSANVAAGLEKPTRAAVAKQHRERRKGVAEIRARRAAGHKVSN